MEAVTLVNTHGRVVDCPKSREAELLSRGYRRPTKEELAEHQSYEVPGQQGTAQGDGSNGELPAVSSLKKSDWLEMAEGLGVDADDSMTKKEIREAIASAE